MSQQTYAFEEWLESLPLDERTTLCLVDAWRAGARALLDALSARGLIGEGVRDSVDQAYAETCGLRRDTGYYRRPS